MQMVMMMMLLMLKSEDAQQPRHSFKIIVARKFKCLRRVTWLWYSYRPLLIR
jgi:hypothetical protein